MWIEPHEALLWCVRLAAGELAYMTQRVEQLSESEQITQPETELSETGFNSFGDTGKDQVKKHPADLNLWIKARHAAMERLAHFSKMALDAGVAERQVRLAEQYGSMLADAIKGILDGLKLSPSQAKRAPDIVRSHLAQLEGGANGKVTA